VTDPCGANNATWNVPADTAQLDWTLRADGHLVVQTQPGFIFTDGTTEKDFGVAPDSGEACPPTTTPGTNPPPPTTVAPTTTISPQLPATGGSSTSLLSLIGMILVLVGGALLVGSNGRRPYGLS
jgi:LPXTG-motif cell wall-anchored protein